MPKNIEKVSENVISGDSLSDVLARIRFGARVFFRSEYCGQWAVDTSGSNHVPFHLVAGGEGWLHSHSAPPQRLKSGHLVLFPHDDPHVLAGTSDKPDAAIVNRAVAAPTGEPATRLVCGYFVVDRVAAAPLLAGLAATIVVDLGQAPGTGTQELIRLWMAEAASQSLGSDVAVDRLAEVVFIHALRAEAACGRLTGVFSALGDSRLGPVVAAIHRDPAAPHRIDEMAAAARLSESAFALRFKKTVGMTAGQYVRHWRLQTAARALQETQRSMADIAASVGYESEVAFRKAFRLHFKQAPGAYRRAARLEAAPGSA